MNPIADIRTDYKQQSLSEKDVLPDPFWQFDKWWKEALHAEIPEANAMTLATASADAMPDARIVLLKGFDTRGFVFFTNYNSAKGEQLLENPRASLVFFWKELERQVRISGLVNLVSEKESDEYFNSRPVNSRIGAWTSPQSEVIADREWLDKKEKEIRAQFANSPIDRPSFWGGYRVTPTRIEFWQGRPSRLHDRILFSLQGNGQWTLGRLAP